jgi:bis(5'-nucleosyl)-tetraphosphatase (symmetrical)
MATYVIGDVHGCFETLRNLLARIPFRPDEDRLWLVGDLVNRGPDSLGVLRWAREISERLGERFVAVLGNHEVHLLARAAGVAEPRPQDTLDELLAAPDRDRLVSWVRRLPLLHRDGDTLLFHGGLLPSWTADQAEALAREVEAVLRRPDGDRLLACYASRDGDFDDDCHGGEPGARAGCALAVLTLLRVVRPDGRPRCGFTGRPEEAPAGDRPWFEVPGRKSAGLRVVFGHWATLGLHVAPPVHALDSGCVWGGALTALRLEDGALFQAPRRDAVGSAA